jgi:hypothetical protein
MVVFAVTTSAARRIGEIGFVVGAVGALVLFLEAALGPGGSLTRLLRALGPLLLAVAFVLGIIYIHWI